MSDDPIPLLYLCGGLPERPPLPPLRFQAAPVKKPREVVPLDLHSTIRAMFDDGLTRGEIAYRTGFSTYALAAVIRKPKV